MRILDRYILKSVLGIFFTCLFTFLFLYIVIDVFSHLEDILRQQVNPVILLHYYSAYLPIIFVQVAPFTCLLSILYTFGKLNRNNEIIAMRSSGLSVLQISKNVIIFGFIVSIIVFLVNDKLVPPALTLTNQVKAEMENPQKKKQNQAEIINNLSIYGMRNRLFFVDRFLPAQNSMEGIIILEHDERQNIVKKTVANKGVYQDGLWKFYQSITYTFDENGQIKEEPTYTEEEIMPIPETPRDFLDQRQQPEYMNIAQLDNYIWKLSKSGAVGVIRNLKVELYQRFVAPFTSVIIILLGIPLSLVMRKRATGISSLGLAIMLGFLYYVLNAVSIALGRAAILAPFIAVSLGHIIALAVSAYLIITLP